LFKDVILQRQVHDVKQSKNSVGNEVNTWK